MNKRVGTNVLASSDEEMLCFLVSGGVLRGTSAKAACARLSQRPYVRLERLDLAGALIAYAKHRQRACDAEINDESEENLETTRENADDRQSDTPESDGMDTEEDRPAITNSEGVVGDGINIEEDRPAIKNAEEVVVGDMSLPNAQARELNRDNNCEDSVAKSPDVLRTKPDTLEVDVDTKTSSDEEVAVIDSTLQSSVHSKSRESTSDSSSKFYDSGKSCLEINEQGLLNCGANSEKIATSLDTEETSEPTPSMERTSLPKMTSQSAMKELAGANTATNEPPRDGGSFSYEDEDSMTVLFDARASRSEMPGSDSRIFALPPFGQKTVSHENPTPKGVQGTVNSGTNSEEIEENSVSSHSVLHNASFRKSREQSNDNSLNHHATDTSAPSDTVSEDIENQSQNALSSEVEAIVSELALCIYLFEKEVAEVDRRLIESKRLAPELSAMKREEIFKLTFDAIQLRASNVKKCFMKISGWKLGKNFSCMLLKYIRKHYSMKYYTLARLVKVCKLVMHYGLDSEQQVPSTHQNSNEHLLQAKPWPNIVQVSAESSNMNGSSDGGQCAQETPTAVPSFNLSRNGPKHSQINSNALSTELPKPQFHEQQPQQSQFPSHQGKGLLPSYNQHLLQRSNQPHFSTQAQQSPIGKQLQPPDQNLKKQPYNQSQSQQLFNKQHLSNPVQGRTQQRSLQQREMCSQQYSTQEQPLMSRQQNMLLHNYLTDQGQKSQAAKRLGSEAPLSQKYAPSEQHARNQNFYQQTPQQSRQQSMGQQPLYSHQQNAQQRQQLKMPHQTNDQQQGTHPSHQELGGQIQPYRQLQDTQHRQQMQQRTCNNLQATQQNRQLYEGQKQIYSQQQNAQPRQLAIPQQTYNHSHFSQQNRQPLEGHKQIYGQQQNAQQQLALPQQMYNQPPASQQNRQQWVGQTQTYGQQHKVMVGQQLIVPQQSCSQQQPIQHSGQPLEGQRYNYNQQQQTSNPQQGSQSRQHNNDHLQNQQAQLSQRRMCTEQSCNQLQLPQHRRYESELCPQLPNQHQQTAEPLRNLQMSLGSVQHSLALGQIHSEQQIAGAQSPRNTQPQAMSVLHSHHQMSQGQVRASMRQMLENQQTTITDAVQHVVTDIMNHANTQQSYTYHYKKATYSSSAPRQGYSLPSQPHSSSVSESNVQAVDVSMPYQNQGNMHPAHHVSNRCVPALPPSCTQAVNIVEADLSEDLNPMHSQSGPQVRVPLSYFDKLQSESLTLKELLQSKSLNDSTHRNPLAEKSRNYIPKQYGCQSRDNQSASELSPPQHEQFQNLNGRRHNPQNSPPEHLPTQMRDARHLPQQPVQNPLQCLTSMNKQLSQHTDLSSTSQSSRVVLNGSSELPIVSQSQKFVNSSSAETSQNASKKRRNSVPLSNPNITSVKRSRTWQMPYSTDAHVHANRYLLQDETHLEDQSPTSGAHGLIGTTIADSQNDPLQRACSRDSGISSTPEPASYSPSDKDGQLNHDKQGRLDCKQTIGNVNGLLSSRGHKSASNDHLTVDHASVHVSETTPSAVDKHSNEVGTIDKPSNAETLSLVCSKSPEGTSSVLGTSDDCHSQLKKPATSVHSSLIAELELSEPKNFDKEVKETTSEDTTSGMLASSVCLSVNDENDDFNLEVEGVASVTHIESNSVRDSVIVRIFSPGKGVDVPTSLASSIAAIPTVDTTAHTHDPARVDSDDKAVTSSSKLKEAEYLFEDPPSPETETSSSSSSLTDPLSPLIDSLPSPSTPGDVDTDLDEFVAIVDEEIEAVTLDAGEHCAQCNQPASLMCACMGVCYCSETCQTAHWSSTHRHDCSRRAKDRVESSVTIPLEAPVSN